MVNESAKEIFERFRKNNYKFFIMNVSKNDFVEILSSDLMEDAIVINASLKDLFNIAWWMIFVNYLLYYSFSVTLLRIWYWINCEIQHCLRASMLYPTLEFLILYKKIWLIRFFYLRGIQHIEPIFGFAKK